MSETIDELVGDADIAVNRLSEIISKIEQIVNRPELIDKNRQLQEIASTMENLKSLNVPIPDELRSLKTKLTAEISVREDVENSLDEIEETLAELLRRVHNLMGFQVEYRTPTGRRANTTSGQVLRQYIINALKSKGGSASSKEILEWMEVQLRNVFLPKDWDIDNNGQITWHHKTHWERLNMKKDGIIKSDSPRGFWELEQDYR